jgi:hypothetical protein
MKKLTTFLGAMGLVFALALLTVAHAAPKSPATTPAAAAAAPATTADPAPVPQEHPEIHAALDALKNARMHLHDAKHDFGGHRVEALRAVDEAIHQLDICMKYDR